MTRARPARVSVIVPIHNVAAYLDACLESLAQQTLADIEVVMVDDGSTDESPEIAARFVDGDPRFRLLRQQNAGQGPARNTGIDDSNGEFLAFLDSDDVLPRNAYRALVAVLDRTGSDLATGNVRRLTSLGTPRATFLGDAFERERLGTHITRFPSLTVDRLVCNKVFRRSFWDHRGFRFPMGVRNEDIPVAMTAHYLAGAVDVLPETVYFWRRREAGDLSGSQRRIGEKALRDRVRAVDEVSRFLADRGMTEAKYHYDRTVLGNDLRYFLDPLDTAGETERQLFLELANDFLDRADPRVLEQPLAIERLKWQLVRRHALPELLEVLRFQVEDLGERSPIKTRRGFDGDYPYRRDPRLGIPGDVYRLDEELALVAKLEDIRLDGETLRLEGYAYIDMIGAPTRGAQSVQLTAVLQDSRRAVRLRTEAKHRPDVTAAAAQQFASLDWSGFAATLDVSRLRRMRVRRTGNWTIEVAVRARGILRTSSRLEAAPLYPLPAVERAVGGVRLHAGLAPNRELQVRIYRKPVAVRSYSLEGGVLRLEGDAGSINAGAGLSVRRRDGSAILDYPLEIARIDGRASFIARVPLDEFVPALETADRIAHSAEHGEGIAWNFFVVDDGRRRRLNLDMDAPLSTWTVGGREIAVQRTRYGGFTLVERSFRPVVTGVEWSPAGALILRGSFRGPIGKYVLVLRKHGNGEAHTASLEYDGQAGRFEAALEPGSIDSLVGTHPLGAGQWEVLAAPANDRDAVPVSLMLDPHLLDVMPLTADIGDKRFSFGVLGYQIPILDVSRDLNGDERGGFGQRRLRTAFYQEQRRGELRETILYDCFGGREYSDNPRAIHEELVRRGAPYDHLWIVRDGAFSPPPSATHVRELSKEYYEAYATARYVVANDCWSRGLVRRPEQTWLQTWHGSPLKRLGHDLAGWPKAAREYRRAVRQAGENWHYLLSAGELATPVLRRAFSPDASVLETGLPRTDLLLSPNRDRVALEVKRRLGVPTGKRIILYAPTYRDHLKTREAYRVGPLLDLAGVRAGLGAEDVVLFHRHRRTVGAPPFHADGVMDVSTYPDATELLVVADVLVTDYSSAIFDYTLMRRPIIFFTPDLEVYRDDVRGFSIDFEREAPGPLLRTTDEVVDALRDIDAVRGASAQAYDLFAAAYAGLNDGRAAARVVDSLFHL